MIAFNSLAYFENPSAKSVVSSPSSSRSVLAPRIRADTVFRATPTVLLFWTAAFAAAIRPADFSKLVPVAWRAAPDRSKESGDNEVKN